MTTFPRPHLPSAVAHAPAFLRSPYLWGTVGAGALITALSLSSLPHEQQPSADTGDMQCGFVRVEKGDGALTVIDHAAADAGLTEGVGNPADAVDALEAFKGDEPLYPNERWVMYFRNGQFVVGTLVSVPDSVNSCADYANYTAHQNATPSPTPTAQQS
jgi:hypothetical protein